MRPRCRDVGGARTRQARRQAGLSLVELMVALALGAFITIGIVQIFTANQATYRVNIGQARMQESARFALEFLKVPIRMAGYAGCFSDEGAIEPVVAEVAGALPYEVDFPTGALAGHEATADDVWSPALAGLPAAIPAANIVSGTDVLTVRLADSNGARLVDVLADTEDAVEAQLPDDANDYDTGNFMVVSDCEKAVLFQSTNSTFGGSSMTIAHSGGSVAGVDPGNRGTGQLGTVGFGIDATVHAVETRTFYIAPGAGTNNRGAAPLSLWSRMGTQPPAELVEGIEDLQVTYGVDTDDDGVPNRYRTFQNVTDLARVMTVRIAITANSVDVVTGVGDGLLRRTFTNTIALRHRIGG